jgi:hypothetical protein
MTPKQTLASYLKSPKQKVYQNKLDNDWYTDFPVGSKISTRQHQGTILGATPEGHIIYQVRATNELATCHPLDCVKTRQYGSVDPWTSFLDRNSGNDEKAILFAEEEAEIRAKEAEEYYRLKKSYQAGSGRHHGSYTRRNTQDVKRIKHQLKNDSQHRALQEAHITGSINAPTAILHTNEPMDIWMKGTRYTDHDSLGWHIIVPMKKKDGTHVPMRILTNCKTQAEVSFARNIVFRALDGVIIQLVPSHIIYDIIRVGYAVSCGCTKVEACANYRTSTEQLRYYTKRSSGLLNLSIRAEDKETYYGL